MQGKHLFDQINKSCEYSIEIRSFHILHSLLPNRATKLKFLYKTNWRNFRSKPKGEGYNSVK